MILTQQLKVLFGPHVSRAPSGYKIKDLSRVAVGIIKNCPKWPEVSKKNNNTQKQNAMYWMFRIKNKIQWYPEVGGCIGWRSGFRLGLY